MFVLVFHLNQSRVIINLHVTLQDIKFTMQAGRLWMLQCCIGKRTCVGVVTITIDMVFEMTHHYDFILI